MTITEQREYQRLLARFIGETQLLQQLDGKTILLTGATGMIGSFLVDVLMTRNRQLPRSTADHRHRARPQPAHRRAALCGVAGQ